MGAHPPCILALLVLFPLELLCRIHQPSHCSIVQTSSNSSVDAIVTASITRKLAFPDFRDEEKTDALTLLGSAAVDRSSGVIRIPGTADASSSPQDLANLSGRALYSFPFRMMDAQTGTPSSFHTTFSFKIDKLASVEDDGDHGGADGGLTFLIGPDELTMGRHGGWLGMMNDACDDTYKPFAIEFDTFKNEEFQDPNDNHIGINFGSIVSHETADASAAGISFSDGSEVRAWISYDSLMHVVNVSVAKEGDVKPPSPHLSSSLDLSQIFKEYMFVGFSGGTGSMAQVHSILSWHFSTDSTGILRLPKDETCVKRLAPSLIGHGAAAASRKAPSAFIIFCLVILVVVLGFLNIACMRWKKVDGGDGVKLPRLPLERPRPLQRPRRFSLLEVLEATRVFNEDELLGHGKNGMFYKGVLADGSQVAVKRLYPGLVQKASFHPKRITKEIGALSNLHHPNLVAMRGWCIVKGEILLLYEYMPNGSLDQWLLSEGTVFPWVRRYKVVKEIASAMAYLHAGTEKPVVHRNFKLSNVLLDVTFRARIGDYGIAKGCREGGAAAKEQDVYRFGVVLLEVVSGRRSREGLQESESSGEWEEEGGKKEDEEEEEVVDELGRGLVEWVWSLQEGGRVMEAIDEELVQRGAGGYYSSWEGEVATVLSVGLLCTLDEPSARPPMSTVVKYLQGEEGLPKIPTRRRLQITPAIHQQSPRRLPSLCMPMPPLQLCLANTYALHTKCHQPQTS